MLARNHINNLIFLQTSDRTVDSRAGSDNLLPHASLAQPVSYIAGQPPVTKSLPGLYELVVGLVGPDGVVGTAGLCRGVSQQGVPVHGRVPRIGDVEASITMRRRRRRGRI